MEPSATVSVLVTTRMFDSRKYTVQLVQHQVAEDVHITQLQRVRRVGPGAGQQGAQERSRLW